MDENREKFISICNIIIDEMMAINRIMTEIEKDLLECQEHIKEHEQTIDQDIIKEQ